LLALSYLPVWLLKIVRQGMLWARDVIERPRSSR